MGRIQYVATTSAMIGMMRSRAAEFARLLLPYVFAVLVNTLAISSDDQLKIFNAAE